MKYIIKRNNDEKILAIRDTEKDAETYAFNYYLNSGYVCDIELFDDQLFADHYDIPSEVLVKVVFNPASNKRNCRQHMFTSVSTKYEEYKDRFESDDSIVIPENEKSGLFYMKFKIEKDYKNDYEKLYKDFEKKACKLIKQHNLL